ncbi:hypothetical protein BXZ70DRAFT_893997 [Cristinia sonorae]|uniref:Uncharacterized protein n=1 Tax=Cristinia sonorae TaxID=1940300 RepID=A0A8K0XPB8_9AGAR|nr:hypothetical protein BXZ70DRAFT_893997 [Cristinia sonorae]
MTNAVASYPPELLSVICGYVYAAGQLPPQPSLDPLVPSSDTVPTGLPSSYPPSHWTDVVVRHSLANLCLVNHAWYEAAKPFLWRQVEVRLPRDWLSIVEEIAGGDEEIYDEEAFLLVDQTLQRAESAALASSRYTGEQFSAELAKALHEKVIATLSGPDGSIPPELLSPPATRDPSPRRLRQKSKSPARWKLMRSISDAVQNVMEKDHPGLYGKFLILPASSSVPDAHFLHAVPAPHDPRPGRFILHLDFNHFRTIGMRRSVEEGFNNRFVTGDRLKAVLKELPNLLVFGATEYMDGALTLPVIQELLLRGSPSRGRGRPSRGRDVLVVDPTDPEEEERERRRDCKELEALDLTGCVSAVFVKALTEFVDTHLPHHLVSDSDGSEQDAERSRRRRSRSRAPIEEEPLVFPGLQRLGLRGVKSIPSDVLHSLVLSFPSLTHLDLSCTRINGELLDALGASPTIRLKSLALERCNWLTGDSIRSFLVNSPCAHGITELSLYGDHTFPSPLSEEDLTDIFAHAPCFRSGKLVYLDLSSAPLTRHILLDVAAEQPSLRSLGLSYIRNLELSAISDFLRIKASHTEVLTLVMTSPELGYGTQQVSSRHATIAIHLQLIRPLCTPPFSFSLTPSTKPKTQPPTRLRVIELAPPLLAGLGVGADSWRIVKSKGGRGWYVDTASGWIATPGEVESGSELKRDLPVGHPWRNELERLADANGNVSSGVGWHARKMEVLHGHGLLGRESGLYGAVSFAYQG